MSDRIGIMIIQGKNVPRSAEMHNNPDAGLRAFRELRDSPDGTPAKAAFVTVDMQTGESEAEIKDLPEPRGEESWGWTLGEGSVKREDFKE